MPKSSPKPKKPKPPELPQSERFKRFAEEHGATDPDALDRAFDAGQVKTPKPKD